MHQESDARFAHAFVLGVPRCGSSLVGRILDSHPHVFSPGELARLDLALKHEKPCSCGAPLEACEFWKPRLGILADARYDYLRFTPEVFERLRATTDAKVLVDVSKRRIWRMTHGLRAPLRGHRAGFILVLRDPRGIMASNLRRWRSSFHTRLRKYRKWMRRHLRFCGDQGDRALIVKYEDLCRDPRGEIQRMCAFLGLEYREEMLRPGDQVHHMIHSSSSSSLEDLSGIRLDERWREELDAEHLAAVEDVMRGMPLIRENYLDVDAAQSTPAPR